MRLRWLGTSTWILAAGDTTVVVDPFFSRPGLGLIVAAIVLPGMPIASRARASRIRAVLPALPTAPDSCS